MNFDRMRALLLEQAIRGELVPQLDSEGAVEQVGDIPEEVPFEIPESWKWVKLNGVGRIVGGGTPKTAVGEYWGGEISWLTPADLGKNKNKFISVGVKSITEKGLKESSAQRMPKGSIVYSSRAPIGHIAIASNDVCTNQGCKSFVPNFDLVTSDWAYYVLIARTDDIKSRASGTTFKEISGKGVGETWVPLPPIAEQQRIVAKLEKAFAEIDRAEKAYQELQTLSDALTKQILQKAIQGRLVPQLESEPAVEAFTEEPEDVPFAIPEKWKWANLSTIANIIAGQSPSGMTVSESPTGIEFHQGKSFFTENWLAQSNKYTTSPSKIAPENSILMSVRAPVGDVNLTNRTICIGRGLFGIIPNSNVDLLYLYAVLKTKKQNLESLATGTTFKAITGKIVKDILIPVPPLEEQRRIVSKLEELLNSIDQLGRI